MCRSCVLKMKVDGSVLCLGDIFSMVLLSNSLHGNQKMAGEGDNELILCLNKAISIYIYKITSHKYIWQDNVFNFWQRG